VATESEGRAQRDTSAINRASFDSDNIQVNVVVL
jgi:hypothetical protein